jgi:ABC-type lipoprotein export system ATPase subunit
VIVTHDTELARQTNRIITLKNGRIENIEQRAGVGSAIGTEAKA